MKKIAEIRASLISPEMIIREALVIDIQQIQLVRNSVKENRLSNPNLVTDADCEEFMFQRGKGWVCEIEEHIVGFAIVDLKEHNIWALFLHPNFENKGIGRQLHDVMLNWYFSKTQIPIWLGTAPNTRAETFYRNSGWKHIGMHGKGEVKFEMTFENWKQIESKKETH
ncbi:MAG: GNAT family N-acetyltransferase [Flavobacteriaceae bacterium]|nr:GNAT family N-acetyltransferase [Mangrovimonas sp.]